MIRRRDTTDSLEVRRASRAVALQITIASGALVVAAVGIAFIFVLDQLRPAEINEPPQPGEHKIYIDTTAALGVFIVVGVLAIVIAGVLSIIVTRRAVRPLGEALERQRNFIADASHELRTPLAVLDARLQLLQRRLAPDDPSAPAITELRGDTQTLIEVVNDLLLAAGPERETLSEPSPLHEPVERAVLSLQVLAHDNDVALRLVTLDDVATSVPPTSIQRCATALIDNALTHSPAGSEVTVTVRRDGEDAVLTVRDQGAGVTGIEPARIFDRFARTESQATGRTRAGFGIGLALVREIAVRYGGTVAVASTGSAGTSIEMRVPSA